jgi:6-phosphogluconolactonase
MIMKNKTLIYIALIIPFGCNQTSDSKRGSQNQEKSMNLFVGTYTGKGSDGIYMLKFDTETGSLTDKLLVAETPNPSFLAISKDRKYIYAANESSPGSVSSFKWDEENRRLEFINQQPTQGAHPCYVAINHSGEKIVAANYSSGNIAVFDIDNGKINDSPTIRQHEGKGPTGRQKGPHAHFSQFTPNDSFIYAVDLGIDEVVAYPINSKGSVGEGHTALKLDGGDGPRHMAFHPSKDLVFIINELSSSVVSAKADHKNGRFEMIDKISTLPEDFEGKNSCADIHIGSDGKFLYASNRGHNSIAIFSVADNGKLKMLGTEHVKGDWPRNFTISPDGNYLLVANQRSNNIVVFGIDKNTGLLNETGYEAEISNPVCLKFN